MLPATYLQKLKYHYIVTKMFGSGLFGYFRFMQKVIRKKIENRHSAKIEVRFLSDISSFIALSIGHKKFSFADVEIIIFHNLLFVNVQILKPGCLQKKIKFLSKNLSWVFGAW